MTSLYHVELFWAIDCHVHSPAVATPGAPPLYTVLPFAVLLLTLALCPLVAGRWWERNGNKFLASAALGLPILVLYLVRDPQALVHMAQEYVSFIVLLGGLYVIAGGVLL